LAYKVDFDFKKFEDNKFYAIPPLSHHGIQDLWFISNTNDMNLFCLMFDWIKNINHFPHKFTHSHWLAEQFLRKTKLIERLAFFGPERPWDLGKEGVKNGSAPLVRDFYEISELTLDEDMGRVREEIKNNARRVIK